MQPFYKYHIFFCTNERPENHPKGCCASKNSLKLRNYMKSRLKELSIDDSRVNIAGCLDQCEKGPVVVIYPEGIWYSLSTIIDIEKVISEHILNGNPVKSLMIDVN